MKTKAMPIVKYESMDIAGTSYSKKNGKNFFYRYANFERILRHFLEALLKLLLPPGFDKNSLDETYPLVLNV